MQVDELLKLAHKKVDDDEDLNQFGRVVLNTDGSGKLIQITEYLVQCTLLEFETLDELYDFLLK